MTRKILVGFWLTTFLLTNLFAQNTFRLMTYNLLNFPGDDAVVRLPDFRTIVSDVQPDVLVGQELQSLSGVNQFLNDVLNTALSGYAAGTFVQNFFGASAIFYKTSKFTFLATIAHPTTLRDIAEFQLQDNQTGEVLRIFSVHLKASSSPSNEAQRAAEVDVLRQVTDALPSGSFFIVCGDFNIYHSSELAFQKLLEEKPNSDGDVNDPLNSPGTWHNNSSFAAIHTQSTRTTNIGSGVPGGLDDRFDMILPSDAVMASGGFTYVADSYTTFGNDGMHFNDDINTQPNTAVSPAVADALQLASDHLPLYADFLVESSGAQISRSVDILPGWNLLGLPAATTNSQYQAIFPNAVAGTFFSYDGAYQAADSFHVGAGYWLNFSAGETVSVTGVEISSATVNLATGWNLISGLSSKIAVADISDPGGIIIPNTIFGYNGSYFQADTLEPGKGYWLNTSGTGQITLNAAGKTGNAVNR